MSYSVISERFVDCVLYLKEQGIINSYRQFAIKLDFHPQSLNEILKKKRNVTVELLQKACNVFALSPNYLHTGQGPMILDGQETMLNMTDTQGLQKIVHVPGFEQGAYEASLEDEHYIKKLPSFSLPDISQNKGRHRCFEIKCDSMEPTLYHGDKVVCSFVPKEDWERSLKDNFVYAVIAQGDVMVKRISNNIKSDNSISLYSDNKYYESLELQIEEVKEIWYVNMKISPFMPSPNHQRNALHLDIDNMRDTISQQSNVIKTLNSTIEKLLKQNRTRT